MTTLDHTLGKGHSPPLLGFTNLVCAIAPGLKGQVGSNRLD